jgi:hypothetical protein
MFVCFVEVGGAWGADRHHSWGTNKHICLGLNSVENMLWKKKGYCVPSFIWKEGLKNSQMSQQHYLQDDCIMRKLVNV